MTYWRSKAGRRGGRSFESWPPASSRTEFAAWCQGGGNADTWRWRLGKVAETISTDVDLAAARFAHLASRCCLCGRPLTEPASKFYGVGPECRQGLTDSALSAYAEAMGRAHATALDKKE